MHFSAHETPFNSLISQRRGMQPGHRGGRASRPAEHHICAELHGPSYARTMESLGRHIRFADNGELVPQMFPVGPYSIQ